MAPSDPIGALPLAEGLGGTPRRRLFYELGGKFRSQEGIVTAIKKPDDLSAYLDGWARLDPRSALQWAETLNESKSLIPPSRAIESAIRVWALNEPGQAIEWVRQSSLPPSVLGTV